MVKRATGRPRAMSAGAIVVAMALGAAACGSPTPEATPPATSTMPTIVAPTVAPEVIPELNPNGTALQNLDYFDYVLRELIAETSTPTGRQIIDRLAESGFDKSQMELTPERTPIGGAADNIQFSVKINGTCLLGQSGNVGFITIAADLLATDTCLVGNTQPINW